QVAEGQVAAGGNEAERWCIVDRIAVQSLARPPYQLLRVANGQRLLELEVPRVQDESRAVERGEARRLIEVTLQLDVGERIVPLPARQQIRTAEGATSLASRVLECAVDIPLHSQSVIHPRAIHPESTLGSIPVVVGARMIGLLQCRPLKRFRVDAERGLVINLAPITGRQVLFHVAGGGAD